MGDSWAPVTTQISIPYTIVGGDRILLDRCHRGNEHDFGASKEPTTVCTRCGRPLAKKPLDPASRTSPLDVEWVDDYRWLKLGPQGWVLEVSGEMGTVLLRLRANGVILQVLGPKTDYDWDQIPGNFWRALGHCQDMLAPPYQS